MYYFVFFFTKRFVEEHIIVNFCIIITIIIIIIIICLPVDIDRYLKDSKQIYPLRQRANASNVSFRITLQWPIHIINPADKTNLSFNARHRRSTKYIDFVSSLFSLVTDMQKTLIKCKI